MRVPNAAAVRRQAQRRAIPASWRPITPPLHPKSLLLLQPQNTARALILDDWASTRQKPLNLYRWASTSPAENSTPRRTELYDLHVQNGAKMVPFGGYSMPVQYADLSVGDSHRWTRYKASLFDVGHMVQHRFSGAAAQMLLERVTPASLASLATNYSTLSCFLHPTTGGIVDDTVITRLGPETFYLVTNAACREKDIAYLDEQIAALPADAGKPNWEILDGHGLVALQGPLSGEILRATLVDYNKPDLDKLYFGQCTQAQLQLESGKQEVQICRGGYTGEDGFEISVPPGKTVAVGEALLNSAGPERLRLAGLGARDSLRLEAGMCLYGHDLDDKTTPVEGGLSWVVGKDRRTEGGFHGAETILRQLRPKKEGGGVERRRVGLVVEGAPAREGAEIVNEGGDIIGNVTSGCPSPTLGTNIAMGYVKSGFNKSGTKVGVVVRGKRRPAEVVKMPFVATQYWKQR